MTRQNLKLWWNWLVATAPCPTAGLFLLYMGMRSANVNWRLAGTIILLIMGLLQFLVVLRGYFARSISWVPATGAGWIFSLFIGELLYRLAAPIFNSMYNSNLLALFTVWLIYGGFTGFCIGLFQWLTVLRQMRNAFLWLGASTLSFATGFALATLFARFGDTRSAIDTGTLNVPVILVGSVLGGVIIGAISGLAMIRIIDRRFACGDATSPKPGVGRASIS